MYAIYGNIHHQYTPNVSIYTSTMDPMGYRAVDLNSFISKRPFFVNQNNLSADPHVYRKRGGLMLEPWQPLSWTISIYMDR